MSVEIRFKPIRSINDDSEFFLIQAALSYIEITINLSCLIMTVMPTRTPFHILLATAFVFFSVGCAFSQAPTQKDTSTLKKKASVTPTKSTAAATESNFLADFINAINNAGKSASSTAKAMDEAAEKTSEVATVVASKISAYASDSSRQKFDSIAHATKSQKQTPPKQIPQKKDTTKRKSVFDGVFDN